jgi:hypothetical protein
LGFVQIEGALWHVVTDDIPDLEHLARTCRGRSAVPLGAMIEHKNSGMVLSQQVIRRGLPATAID